MRSWAVAVAVVAAAAVVGVMGNAIPSIPSAVYRKDTYAANSDCTGTIEKVESAPVNYCSFADRNSTMVVVGAGGNLTRLTWSAGFNLNTGTVGMCSGPYAAPTPSGDGELTTASGVCIGRNVKYTYPITDAGAQWGTQTLYRDGDCNQPMSGPVSFRLNTCLPDGNGNSFTYVLGVAGSNQWVKTTWTGSTTCSPAGAGAADNARYGNVCLAPPPGGSFSFQYTNPPTPASSSTAAAASDSSSSTGTNAANAVHSASLLPVGVAAMAAVLITAAL